MDISVGTLSNLFGPIEAEDLLDEFGNLSSKYAISNTFRQIQNLSNPRALIVGRKGTGKTTFLHMQHSAKKLRCVLDIGSEFPAVVEVLSGGFQSNYTEISSRTWDAVIWNSVILTVQREISNKETLLSWRDISVLNEYGDNLESKIKTTTTSKFSKATKDVSRSFAKGTPGLIVAMLAATLDDELDMSSAKSVVEKLLKAAGKTVSILIDTMEGYSLVDNPAATGCMRGLLNCCAGIHRQSKYVECKLFFPDELTHYFQSKVSHSILKDFRDVHYLHWTSPELLILAALKFRDTVGESSLADWNLSQLTQDQSDSWQFAQSILHRFLPITVTNDNGMQTESWSYIVRHTQLTPRQIILILNRLARHCFKISGAQVVPRKGKLTEKLFHEEMKICARVILRDIFATYREIYPNIEKVVSRVIPSVGLVFSDDDLRKAVSKIKVAEEYNMDSDDVKTAMADMGVIGIQDVSMSNDNSAYGEFSYMNDEVLFLSSGDMYCVHPIMSAIYRPSNSDGRIVFPSGSSAVM